MEGVRAAGGALAPGSGAGAALPGAGNGTLAGGAANRRARKALRIAVRTMWAYQSPDGDVAYMGRSQGQAWALAFALLASARAAGRGCDDQTQDFLAVGDRAVRRLGALHPVGPDGMAIVPSANGPATTVDMSRMRSPTSGPESFWARPARACGQPS